MGAASDSRFYPPPLSLPLLSSVHFRSHYALSQTLIPKSETLIHEGSLETLPSAIQSKGGHGGRRALRHLCGARIGRGGRRRGHNWLHYGRELFRFGFEARGPFSDRFIAQFSTAKWLYPLYFWLISSQLSLFYLIYSALLS